jgi:pantoate--beta-alanine ligase
MGFDRPAMRIVHTIADLRAALSTERAINFVPTMGNLHQGHLSLVRVARQRPGLVVASIFVNPLQFAPHEDFAAYPRTLTRDCELLASGGCDIVFAPSAREMYPEDQTYTIQAPAALADILEGSFRPGFFVGVCTVVMKLFAIVQPSAAVFGKKDYQQLLVIKHMVQQFALDLDVIAGETVRSASGLALSSRNGYLDDAERVEAAELQRVLRGVADAVRAGPAVPVDVAMPMDYAALEAQAMTRLAARGWAPDYVAIRRQRDLSEAKRGDATTGDATPRDATPRDAMVVLGAAKLGRTRLIDNIEV